MIVTELKGEHTCNHRWKASRVEVHTAPVEHVCLLPKDHPDATVHVCSCGSSSLTFSDLFGWADEVEPWETEDHAPPELGSDGLHTCAVCGEYADPAKGSCSDCGATWKVTGD